MQVRLPRTLAGALLTAFGAALFVALPSDAAGADVRLYLHSAAGTYEGDVQDDPEAGTDDRAPAGSTISETAPTKTAASTADWEPTPLILAGTLGNPTWTLPYTGAVSEICVDVWAEANSTPVGLVIQPILNTPDAFVRTDSIEAAGYAGGIVRLTGKVKAPAATTAPADTEFMLGSPADSSPGLKFHYDSLTMPSSITVNPTGACTAATLPLPGGGSGSASADPSESTSEEPSEDPSASASESASEEPSEDPSTTPSASACPSATGSGDPSEEPSEEPSEDPSASASASTTASPSQSTLPIPTLGAPEANRAAADADDDPCAPASAATTTTYTGADTTRFNDVLPLTAQVTTQSGPASGGTVTFNLSGSIYTAPVGANGLARVDARMIKSPNLYILRTTYSGTAALDPSADEAGLRITKTSTTCGLQRAANGRFSTLQAVIVRPDRSRVAGAIVDFAYNGHGFRRTHTNARGISRIENAPLGRPGDRFSVIYIGDVKHTGCTFTVTRG